MHTILFFFFGKSTYPPSCPYPKKSGNPWIGTKHLQINLATV